MNEQQRRFVQEYLVDLNATEAAQRAGYSKKTADTQASRMLRNVKVKEAIEKGRQKQVARTEVRADKVIREYARIAFANMRTYLKFGPDGVEIADSETLSDDDMAAVAEVTQTVTECGRNIKFKLHSKTEALRDLGRHLALFVDRNEHTGKGGGPIIIDIESARRGLLGVLGDFRRRLGGSSSGESGPVEVDAAANEVLSRSANGEANGVHKP